MIINLDKEIKGWYNEGESINKMMLGGWRIFQKFSPDTDPKGEYRWVVVPDDYICSGTTKMEKLKKQVTYDGGNWQDVVPPIYKAGDVIEYNSEDCGYIPPQYRWVNINPLLEYVCVGVDKYYKQQKQVSWDGGVSWENVEPSEYRTGDLYQADSEDCGYIPPQYRDVSGTPYCVNYDKMVDVEHQVSFDGGETWSTTSTTTTMLEHNSEFCGYTAFKLFARNSSDKTKTVECDSSTRITQNDINNLLSGTGWSRSSARYIEVGTTDCVNQLTQYSFEGITSLCNVHIGEYITTIGDRAFENSTRNITFEEGLTTIGSMAFFDTSYSSYSLTLPSTVRSIGNKAFANNARNTITLTSAEPPTIGGTALENQSGSGYNIIKVPCEYLNKYQKRWYSYTTNNQRLIESIYPIENDCWDTSGNKCTFEYQYDLSPVVVKSGTVKNNNVTILDGSEIDKIAKPTTHAHFVYNSINITNKPLSLYNLHFKNVTIASDNRINQISGSFSGSTFANNEFPSLPYIETISNSFRHCAFTSITLSDTITTIDGGAFNYCSNLQNLTLGSGLTKIGLDTFEVCTSLTTITCKAVVPPTLGIYVFYMAPINVIYVPSESVEAYKADSKWGAWADKIQAIP